MSAQNNAQPADILLADAAKSISVIIPAHVNSSTEAILIGFHALIAKLDVMEKTLLEALRKNKAGI